MTYRRARDTLRPVPVRDCRTYWGTHGCSRPRLHAGACECERGCPRPFGNRHVFGEDRPRRTLRMRRIAARVAGSARDRRSRQV